MASLGRTGTYVHSAQVAGYTYESLINKMLDVAAVRYFGLDYEESARASEAMRSGRGRRERLGTDSDVPARRDDDDRGRTPAARERAHPHRRGGSDRGAGARGSPASSARSASPAAISLASMSRTFATGRTTMATLTICSSSHIWIPPPTSRRCVTAFERNRIYGTGVGGVQGRDRRRRARRAARAALCPAPAAPARWRAAHLRRHAQRRRRPPADRRCGA